MLWDVAYTTGTTSGKPSPFYNTAHDAYAIWDQARRCNEAEGLDAGDRVANLYPLAGFPTGAFLSVVRSGMVVGFSVAHGLTGAANSEFKVRNSLSEAVATIARFRPTVLWGVPSFIRRFLDEAGRRGADLSDVQRIVTSGSRCPRPCGPSCASSSPAGRSFRANPRPLCVHRDARRPGAMRRGRRAAESLPGSLLS